jgi:glucose-6-phosphate 1-dehydrogenase
MPQKRSQIILHYIEPSHYTLAPEQRQQISNKLIMRPQPDEDISLHGMTKEQGRIRACNYGAAPIPQLQNSISFRAHT